MKYCNFSSKPDKNEIWFLCLVAVSYMRNLNNWNVIGFLYWGIVTSSKKPSEDIVESSR